MRVAGKRSAASFHSAGWFGALGAAIPNLNPNDVPAPQAEINSTCHHLCPHDNSPRHPGDVLFDINPLEAFLVIHLVFPNQLQAQGLQKRVDTLVFRRGPRLHQSEDVVI